VVPPDLDTASASEEEMGVAVVAAGAGAAASVEEMAVLVAMPAVVVAPLAEVVIIAGGSTVGIADMAIKTALTVSMSSTRSAGRVGERESQA
jgi:hypothetical protein